MKKEEEGGGVMVVTSLENSNELVFMISCETCRQKHRKCDRTLPKCDQCVRRNEDCCYRPPIKPTTLNRKKRGEGHDDETLPSKRKSSSRSSMKPTQKKRYDVMNRIEFVAEELIQNYYPQEEQSRLRAIEEYTKCETIPRGVPLPALDLERVERATWLGCRAYLLMHLQVDESNDSSSSSKTNSDLMNRLQDELLHYGKVNVDTSDLKMMTEKYSLKEIRDTADILFQKSKELVLHPDLYPYVAQNEYLASACCQLFNYIIGRNWNYNEAKLLMTAVKVFLSIKSGVVEVNTSMFGTAQQREDIELMKASVLTTIHGYYGVKYILFVNDSIDGGKMSLNTKQINKAIGYMIKFFYGKRRPLSSKSSFDYDRFPFAKMEEMKDITRSTYGPDRILRLCDAFDELLMITDWMTPGDLSEEGIWTVLLTLFQYTLVVTEYRNPHHEMDMRKKLLLLNIAYANKISLALSQYKKVNIMGEPTLIRAYTSIAETHRKYASDLLYDSSTSVQQLAEILAFLHTDLAYFDHLFKMYLVMEAKGQSLLLSQTIADVSFRIQQLYPATLAMEPSSSSRIYSTQQSEWEQESVGDILTEAQGDETLEFFIDEIDFDAL